MAACSRFCSLVLSLHVYVFTLLIATEFLVGFYTEDVLAFILTIQSGWLSGDASWVLRDVINKHKFVGKALAISSGIMMLQKVWLLIAKPPRPDLSSSTTSSLLIQQHWWILILLLPAQYLTTVMAGDVAAFFGVSPQQVFALHWPIALVIVTLTVLLLVQKLFLLPNALLRAKRGRRDSPKKRVI